MINPNMVKATDQFGATYLIDLSKIVAMKIDASIPQASAHGANFNAVQPTSGIVFMEGGFSFSLSAEQISTLWAQWRGDV